MNICIIGLLKWILFKANIQIFQMYICSVQRHTHRKNYAEYMHVEAICSLAGGGANPLVNCRYNRSKKNKKIRVNFNINLSVSVICLYSPSSTNHRPPFLSPTIAIFFVFKLSFHLPFPYFFIYPIEQIAKG